MSVNQLQAVLSIYPVDIKNSKLADLKTQQDRNNLENIRGNCFPVDTGLGPK